MLDFSLMDGIVIAFVAAALYAYWLVWRLWDSRLLRCPETGAITLVRVAPTPAEPGKAPTPGVENCGLWPERKGCAQGCLARCSESAPGYRVNVEALRPFRH